VSGFVDISGIDNINERIKIYEVLFCVMFLLTLAS
jgi:hypothetical protein